MSEVLRRIAGIADSCGAFGALRTLRPRLPLRWLTILTYHRVIETPDEFPFDRGVVDASPAQFDEQMGMLRRDCTPIGLPELRAFLDGAELPPNAAMVTFDDGYRDNIEVAFPILERWRVPAVFFVATDYITRRRLFWWDRITYLLLNTAQRHLRLDYPQRLEFDLPAERNRALQLLLRMVKSQYRLDLTALLEELTRACDLSWDDRLEARLANQQLMSWEDLKTLTQRGMEVQSHTVTHRPLQNLARSDLEDELTRSRVELEERLGTRVDSIASPGGYPLDRIPPLLEAMRTAGYVMGFSNATGATPLERSRPLQFARVAAAPEWSLSAFRAALHTPPGAGRRHC